MAAAEREALATTNSKKGLAVEINIPMDGIGSEHVSKPAQIHRRPSTAAL